MAENFDLIFGQNASQQYAWSDSDYQDGWETVGNIPPTAAQFDALQRRNDMKAKELNDNLTPLVNANTADTRQPATAYNEGDMKFSPLLPTGWFLTCTVAGNTSAGEIVLPSPVVENASVVDGSVTWTIRKIGSGGGEAIGIIKAFAGNGDIPAGYLLCDGSAVSRTMFPDLFAAIGTTYGAGDGSTTFNVPDYNTAQRFAQGGTVAGVEKDAGLPNITGSSATQVATRNSSASYVGVELGAGAVSVVPQSDGKVIANGSNYYTAAFSINASKSNPIYGASNTVQPNALTTRYIIKAFDGQTADSALIDITQYAQELAGKANITGSNLVHHRDVITTSGTYTAPVTGLYKITVIGGGQGGQGGNVYSSQRIQTGGRGGDQADRTVIYCNLSAGTDIPVTIGAGGAGTAGTTTASAPSDGGAGGKSSITIDNAIVENDGNGLSQNMLAYTIPGIQGEHGQKFTLNSTSYQTTSYPGLGAGPVGYYGSGGHGGGARVSDSTVLTGSNGQNGAVFFEYYTPGA